MESIRYNILGVAVHALDLSRATQKIISGAGMLRRGYVCVTGVHGIIESQDDPTLKEIHNKAFLVTPDGMPLVWLGPKGTSRVYGPDLMLAVCDQGRARQLKHFFYGGAPGVAEKLRQNLCAQFPGLKVTGTFTPPYRTLNNDELVDLKSQVRDAPPDVIWVGLSTPKQERFMAAHWSELDAGLLVGVGAAFDFHTGRVRQAPKVLQRLGLEWLFRLLQEPRRLTPRYLRNNPRFIFLTLLQRLRLRKF